MFEGKDNDPAKKFLIVSVWSERSVGLGFFKDALKAKSIQESFDVPMLSHYDKHDAYQQ